MHISLGMWYHHISVSDTNSCLLVALCTCFKLWNYLLGISLFPYNIKSSFDKEEVHVQPSNGSMYEYVMKDFIHV